MREAAIQIEQVSKSFQGRKVLKNISCELNWGQVYGELSIMYEGRLPE